MVSQANSIKFEARKRMNSIKSLPENRRRENFQARLMRSELITLLPRSDRDIIRKENYGSISLMNIDTIILSKILVDQIK